MTTFTDDHGKLRHGAGARGGQFARRVHREAPGGTSALAAKTVTLEDTVCDLIDEQAPQVAAQRAHELAPDLSDEAFRRHWGAITSAHRWASKFEEDPEGNALEEDPAGSRLIDLEEYREINPADRPGECDYTGYDWERMGLDLAERWRAERARAIRELLAAQRDAEQGERPDG